MQKPEEKSPNIYLEMDPEYEAAEPSHRVLSAPGGEYTHLDHGTDNEGYEEVKSTPVYDSIEKPVTDSKNRNRCDRRIIIMAVIISVLLAIVISVGSYEAYKYATGSSDTDDAVTTEISMATETITSTITMTVSPITTTSTTSTTTPENVYDSTPRLEFGELFRPNGVAVNGETGKIYVADWANDRLCVYDRNGKLENCFTEYRNSLGQVEEFIFVRGVAIGYEETIVVSTHSLVLVLKSDSLTLVQKWGGSLSGTVVPGQFADARNVVVFERKIYVADYNNPSIQVLNLDEEDDIMVIDAAQTPVAFRPYDVAVHPSSGAIYVPNNHSVIVYNRKGKYLKHFTAEHFKQSQVELHSIAVDDLDRLYVGDWGNNCVHILTTGGEYIQQLEQSGRWWPNGISINSINRDLVVTDYLHSDVKVFSYIT